MWKYAALFFIVLAGLFLAYTRSDILERTLEQTVSGKNTNQSYSVDRANNSDVETVLPEEETNTDASSNNAGNRNAGNNNPGSENSVLPRQNKKPSDVPSDKKSKPKPVAVGVIESIWSMLKETYPPDSNEYHKASTEFQQILDEDLVLQQLLKARKNGWNEIVSQALNGELDPNIIVGEKITQFSQELWEIKQSRQQPDHENLKAEDRKLFDQAKRELYEFTETKMKPLGPQSDKLIDVALGSTNATRDDIEALIKSGGELRDTQIVNVILSPNEEAIKLDRLRLLVEYGANINGVQAGDGMTSFEASMVRGDIAIADHLISMGADVGNTDAANIAENFNQESYADRTREYLQELGLNADPSTIEFNKKLREFATRRAKEREENAGKAP